MEPRKLVLAGACVLLLMSATLGLGYITGRKKSITFLEKVGSFQATNAGIVLQENFRMPEMLDSCVLGISILNTPNTRPLERAASVSNALSLAFELEFYVEGIEKPFYKTFVKLGDTRDYHPVWRPDYGLIVHKVAIFPDPNDIERYGKPTGEFLHGTNNFPMSEGKLLPNQEYKVVLKVQDPVRITNTFQLYLFHYNKLSRLDYKMEEWLYRLKEKKLGE